MSYNEKLGQRIHEQLNLWDVNFVEKKMFGGIAFMVKDKMCIGISKDEMMLRVMDEHYETSLEKNHVKPMEFTGKVMKGFLFIEEPAFKKQKDFEYWLKLGLEFGEKGFVKSKRKS